MPALVLILGRNHAHEEILGMILRYVEIVLVMELRYVIIGIDKQNVQKTQGFESPGITMIRCYQHKLNKDRDHLLNSINNIRNPSLKF